MALDMVTLVYRLWQAMARPTHDVPISQVVTLPGDYEFGRIRVSIDRIY